MDNTQETCVNHADGEECPFIGGCNVVTGDEPAHVIPIRERLDKIYRNMRDLNRGNDWRTNNYNTEETQ